MKLRKGYIELTDSGYKIASTIYERHLFLSQYFISYEIPEEIK